MKSSLSVTFNITAANSKGDYACSFVANTHYANALLFLCARYRYTDIGGRLQNSYAGNKPIKNTSKVRVIAAGTKINAPAAITKNPIIIPFLNPALFNKKEAGTDITKYEM